MQHQPTKSICVLGSANVDYFVYVHHIPVPGQTIQSTKYMSANGGKGANQAAAIGKLLKGEECRCQFVGQVGTDDQMRSLMKEMTECKVKLRWIQKNNVGTGKAFIYVDENSGQNSIVIVGGANMSYEQLNTLPEIFVESLKQCSYLVLQKQVPMQINLLAAKLVKSNKEKQVIVIMDCGGRDDPIPEQLIHHLDYISPNQTQLQRIDQTIKTDNKEELVKEIRQKIIQKYPRLKVLLKLGSKGSALVSDNNYVYVPVASEINPKIMHDYKIIDTVGAGDCFTGAFVVRHSELDWSNLDKVEENYRKAMIFANSSAFLCITKKGAMPSMPWRNEVDQIINKYELK